MYFPIDSNEKITVLSNIINSQIDLHRPYGGVFPSLAKREHANNLVPVLYEALEKSGLLKLKTEKSQKLSAEELELNFAKEPELANNFKKVFPNSITWQTWSYIFSNRYNSLMTDWDIAWIDYDFSIDKLKGLKLY
jgi:hypothetical protein